jgi:3-hydroxyisobutyrate dehydrogenase-like beta-hydroxyacid dehydrogenase
MGMDIGFIGLGNMGFPMARRLIEAGHQLVVFDLRRAAVDRLAALGAETAASPAEVADRTETVLASLPSPEVVRDVATGDQGIAQGRRARRFVDLSTTGARLAAHIAEALGRHGIVQLDSPVSGGVKGAEQGTLAVMVSGPREAFASLETVLAVIGRVFFIGERPGAAQTMKLVNNLLSATALAATSEAMVMGVKAGLDAAVMIDVINAGSGRNSASQDKFPRAILPGSFDFGFATGLMLKDLRLCLEEAAALGLPLQVAEAVRQIWELASAETGPDADFTTVIRCLERPAGVEVRAGNRQQSDS